MNKPLKRSQKKIKRTKGKNQPISLSSKPSINQSKTKKLSNKTREDIQSIRI